MYNKYPKVEIEKAITDLNLEAEMGLTLHLPRDGYIQMQLTESGEKMVIFTNDPTAIQIEQWRGHRPFVQKMKEIEETEYEKKEAEANVNRHYRVEFYSGLMHNSNSQLFATEQIFWRGPKNEMEMTEKAHRKITADCLPRSYHTVITLIE